MFVPYAIACSEWNVPVLPVKPWQITFVSLLIHTFAEADIARTAGAMRAAAGVALVTFRSAFIVLRSVAENYRCDLSPSPAVSEGLLMTHFLDVGDL